MAGIRDTYGLTKSLSGIAKYLYIDNYYERDIIMYTSDGSDFDFLLCPTLTAILLYDDSAGTYTNYAARNEAGTFSTEPDLGGMEQTADFWYFCSPLPYSGIYFEQSTVNAGNVSLTGTYPADTAGTDDNTWTSLGSFNDGTETGNACWGQDGSFTWTVPTIGGTGWVQGNLKIGGSIVSGIVGYWTRVAADATAMTGAAALDFSSTISVNSTYTHVPGGTAVKVKLDTSIDHIQVKSSGTPAGTPTLHVIVWGYGTGRSPDQGT